MIGQTISHYHITDKLGSGGMGEVYLAEDTKLKRKVALKFLLRTDTSPEETAVRFRHEAQAAAALSHPNIATVYDVSDHEGRPYIVMERIDGPTLSDYCEAEEPTLDDILDLIVQVGDGLKSAHQAGIVHRDLKPANILVDYDHRRPKILDFGLAKLKDATKVTKTGSTLGTAAYMSPEQSAGRDIDHRADIWSLGVVMYELIARRLPFNGDHMAAIAYAVANEEPEPLARYKSGTPDELQRIVSKCLAKIPDERYQTVADLLADLQKLRRVSVGHGPSEAQHRRRISPLAVGGVSVVIVAVVIWGIFQLSERMATPSASAKSLAVVDFDNVGAEEDAYLASGLAEDLAIKLRQLEGIQVASSADIRRLAKENLLPREIASRLKVHYALGGSLLRQDSLVRVNVELIDKESGNVIWSDQIDREFTQVFEFIDDVSLKIAQALEVRLTPVEKAAIATRPTDNTDAYDHYLKGRHYYYKLTYKDNDLAEREFERALQLDPDYPLALAGLADTYVQRYKEYYDYDEYWLDSADVLIERSLALDPELAEAYESRAEALLEKDNIAGAFAAAEKARDLRPDWDEPYIHLGDIYSLRGERTSALDCFNKALDLRESVDALCGKGNIYRTRGKMDSAKVLYEAAEQLHPFHERPHLELASWYEDEGNAQEMEQHERRAIEVRPDHPQGYYWLSYTLYNRGDIRECEDLLQSYVERFPYCWSGYENLLDFSYWNTGNYSAAFEAVEEAVRRNPDRAWPQLLLAYAYAEQVSPDNASGDTMTVSDKALSAINRALALRPKSGRVQEWAGTVSAGLGRYDQARKYFGRAIELRPGSSTLLSHISNVWFAEGEYQDCFSATKQAISNSPGDPNVYWSLGPAYMRVGRGEEVLGVFERAAEKYNDAPRFLNLLSREQRLAGRFEDAVKSSRLALSRGANAARTHLSIALWLTGDADAALEVAFEETYSWQAAALILNILLGEGRYAEIEQYLESIKDGTCKQVVGIENWADFSSSYLRSMRRYHDVVPVYEERRRSGEETWSWSNSLGIASCYAHSGDIDTALYIVEGLLQSAGPDARPNLLQTLAFLRAIGANDLSPALELATHAYREDLNKWRFGDLNTLLRLQFATGNIADLKGTLRSTDVFSPSSRATYRVAQMAMAAGIPDAGVFMQGAVANLTRMSRVPWAVLPSWSRSPSHATVHLACILARARESKQARQAAQRALKLGPESEDIAYQAACAYSLIGDTTLALQWLETAVDRGYLELWWAGVDPDLDPLRELPRFKVIMDDWDRRIQELVN